MSKKQKLGRRKLAKLEKERKISRRKFIKNAALISTGTAIGLGALTKGVWYMYKYFTYDPRDVFDRGYDFNVKALPKITPRELIHKHTLTTEEHKFNLEELLKSLDVKGKTISDIKFVRSYRKTWLRLEPDMGYANRLIKEANESIEHMVNFLGSGYIIKQNIRFEVPQNVKNINFNEVPGILFYLVADYRNEIMSIYKAKVNGKEGYGKVSIKRNPSGETSREIDFIVTKIGFDFKGYRSNAIIYSTSMDIVKLVETPAIEFLHKCVGRHTVKHIADEVKNINLTYDAIRTSIDKHKNREEKFVHALSILWLRQYNKDRNLGLTEEELTERFEQYEKKDISLLKYNGANKLSRYIARIGIQKSIELYVDNPNELFKVLP